MEFFSDETVAGGGIIGPPTKSGATYKFTGVNASTVMISQRRFTLGTINKVQTPLPLILLEFTARQNHNTVDLQWSTAEEKDNDFFTLERSADGSTFQLVGTITSARNGSLKNHYSFVDLNLIHGQSYYRLTQTDLDGKKESFPIIGVNVITEDGTCRVFPNPATGNGFDLYLPALTEGMNAQVGLLDRNGRTLFSLSLKYTDRNEDSSYSISTPYTLIPGLYILRISYGTEQRVLKLVIR